jgi:class 3 adenylate cyclase
VEIVGPETCPLPDDPALAEIASALNEAGSWGYVLDRQWRLVYMTDDIRLSNGMLRELVPLPIGAHFFGTAAIDMYLGWSGGVFSIDSYYALFRGIHHWWIDDTSEEEVREHVDPRLAGLVGATAADPRERATTVSVPASYTARSSPLAVLITGVRVRDERGDVVGTAFTSKPAAGMSVLGTIAAAGDLGHFTRMQRLANAARRPAAILFGDLEASSPLARRLSTSSYFRARAAPRAGGGRERGAGGRDGRPPRRRRSRRALPGRARRLGVGRGAGVHRRDAVAARLAVRRRRSHRPCRGRCGHAVRAALGSTLHVGHVVTAARAEVNALGDEMNEAARIETCATGGRALASKALVERLEPPDARALDLDPARIGYTALAELPTATEKARRDAGAIAVCEL